MVLTFQTRDQAEGIGRDWMVKLGGVFKYQVAPRDYVPAARALSSAFGSSTG